MAACMMPLNMSARTAPAGSAKSMKSVKTFAPRPARALHTAPRAAASRPAARGVARIVCRDDEDPPPSMMVIAPFQQSLSALLGQRIIRMGGEVNDDICNSLVAQMLYLDAMDPDEDITMYINSPGGSVTAGMAVFDTMRHVRPDVKTVCVGMAASMGAFLLASGTKGKRYTLPNSRIMIHQPLGGAQGQATDIELQAMEMMHHKETLNGFLAEFCGKTMEEMKADTDRDFFLGAHEAVEYGVVDHVLSNKRWDEVAKVDMGMYDFDKYDWRELPSLDPMDPRNIAEAKREMEEAKAKKARRP